MRIMYRVVSKDDDELNIEDLFCKSLKLTVSSDIRNIIPTEKLNAYEDLFLKTTAIGWINKPSHIDMQWVLNYCLDNMECLKVGKKHIYVVKFKDVQFPNTYNTVDSVIRFLDKGNEEFPGMHIFSLVFNKYENSIDRYWKFFVMTKLHRLPLSEVLVIK